MRRISPVTGCTLPATIAISVVLPAPLRPSSPTLAPKGSRRFSRSTITFRRSLVR